MNLPAPVAGPALLEALFADRIVRAAIGALYRELAAYPKPGLISLVASLLYRAAPRGLAFARSKAQRFLDEGRV